MRRQKKSRRKFTVVLSLIIILGLGVLAFSFKIVKFSVISDTLDANDIPDNFTDNTVSAQKVALNDIKNNSSKNVIFFSSSWCGSCGKLNQDLSSIAKEYPDMHVYVYDLEGDRDVANDLEVAVAPTIVLLENGETKNYSEVTIDNLSTLINDFDRIGIR